MYREVRECYVIAVSFTKLLFCVSTCYHGLVIAYSFWKFRSKTCMTVWTANFDVN